MSKKERWRRGREIEAEMGEMADRDDGGGLCCWHEFWF